MVRRSNRRHYECLCWTVIGNRSRSYRGSHLTRKAGGLRHSRGHTGRSASPPHCVNAWSESYCNYAGCFGFPAASPRGGPAGLGRRKDRAARRWRSRSAEDCVGTRRLFRRACPDGNRDNPTRPSKAHRGRLRSHLWFRSLRGPDHACRPAEDRGCRRARSLLSA